MPQKRLAIAEDDSLIRMNLRETLVGLGYLVVGETGDGESAINLARELRPDLMVMDVKMQRLYGLRAAEVLIEERIAPVLLLTAYSDRALVERACDMGVVGYLVKPFREADLLPTIEIAMGCFAELQSLDRQIDDLQQTLQTRKTVEQAKGVLMQTQGLTEAEAYRRIQQLSMNTRTPMKEIAEALLIASQAGNRS